MYVSFIILYTALLSTVWKKRTIFTKHGWQPNPLCITLQVCTRYLLLHNKSLQNLMALGNDHFICSWFCGSASWVKHSLLVLLIRPMITHEATASWWVSWGRGRLRWSHSHIWWLVLDITGYHISYGLSSSRVIVWAFLHGRNMVRVETKCPRPRQLTELQKIESITSNTFYWSN